MSTLKHPPTCFSGKRYAIRRPPLSAANAKTLTDFGSPTAIGSQQTDIQTGLIGPARRRKNRPPLPVVEFWMHPETGRGPKGRPPLFHRQKRPPSPPYPKNKVSATLPIAAAPRPTHSHSPRRGPWRLPHMSLAPFSRPISPIWRAAAFLQHPGNTAPAAEPSFHDGGSSRSTHPCRLAKSALPIPRAKRCPLRLAATRV